MKIRNFLNTIFICFLAFFFSFSLRSQPPAMPPVEKMIKVSIAPDHADWTYKTGEKVKFKIQITKNSEPSQNVNVKYEVGPEMMPSVKKDSLQLKQGYLIIEGGTMKEPGFLRCTVVAEVNGYSYRGLATAGFNPELIKLTTELPADFNEFWEKAKDDATSVPFDARLVLLPERCTENVNVYQASFQQYK